MGLHQVIRGPSWFTFCACRQLRFRICTTKPAQSNHVSVATSHITTSHLRYAMQITFYWWEFIQYHVPINARDNNTPTTPLTVYMSRGVFIPGMAYGVKTSAFQPPFITLSAGFRHSLKHSDDHMTTNKWLQAFRTTVSVIAQLIWLTMWLNSE